MLVFLALSCLRRDFDLDDSELLHYSEGNEGV